MLLACTPVLHLDVEKDTNPTWLLWCSLYQLHFPSSSPQLCCLYFLRSVCLSFYLVICCSLFLILCLSVFLAVCLSPLFSILRNYKKKKVGKGKTQAPDILQVKISLTLLWTQFQPYKSKAFKEWKGPFLSFTFRNTQARHRLVWLQLKNEMGFVKQFEFRGDFS